MPVKDIDGFKELARIEGELRKLPTKAAVKAERFFLRNFDLQGFQSDHGLEKWDARKPDFTPGRKIEVQTGKLRQGVQGSASGNLIKVQVTGPATRYADTQNFGADIPVTAQMKKYFWAMWYKTNNAMWRNMALKKEGSVIKVKARKFIGPTEAVLRELMELFEEAVKGI